MKSLLVIPVFNEETTLPGLIESAKSYIHDIMVIDDGSSAASTLVSVMAGAMTHRFATNMGKGEALKTAFEYAVSQNYDWVFTMDGDGEHDPSDLLKFFSLLDQYDLILGNRGRLADSVFSALVSLVCGKWIPDCRTGFRAYSVGILRSIQIGRAHV